MENQSFTYNYSAARKAELPPEILRLSEEIMRS